MTKREFLNSCEVENLTWMNNGNRCNKFICPICKKGTTFANGKYYHPLDIWEHLDHHPEIKVRVSWKIKDRTDIDFEPEEIEEITLEPEEEKNRFKENVDWIDEELKEEIRKSKERNKRIEEKGLYFSKTDPFEDGRTYCSKCFEWCDVYKQGVSDCCKVKYFIDFEEITKEERKRIVRETMAKLSSS